MKKVFRNITIYAIDALIFLGILFLLTKIGVLWGKLPGDIQIETADGLSSYPFVSGLMILVISSIVWNLTGRFWKKIWP